MYKSVFQKHACTQKRFSNAVIRKPCKTLLFILFSISIIFMGNKKINYTHKKQTSKTQQKH